MKLDYKEIGRRIAHRRKHLGLKQATVEEMADIGEKYLSCIERATSTPSTEVLMRLAIALDTTPGSTNSRQNNDANDRRPLEHSRGRRFFSRGWVRPAAQDSRPR